MSRIIYEDENVREDVYSGTFILDNLRMSPEEIRNKVLEEMHSAGIEVDNENDLIIGYEGASDDDGISDSLSSQFQVYRYVNKKVPYKVEEEYAYGGELTEEEANLPKEKLDELIFDYMRRDGKLDSDESNYEIVIDGSVDNGYDTPVIGYSVYKITSKERLEEDTKYSEEEKVEEKEKLEEALKTLKEEREKLNSIGNVEEKNKAIEELLNKVGNIENNVSSDVKDFSVFNKELEEIDEEIKKLKKDINTSADNYQATYQKLQDVIDEQNAKMDNEKLSTEKELEDILEEYGKKKLEINEESIELISKMDNQKRMLRSLTRKKNALKRDIANAEALDLTYDEYKDITSTLRKKNVMNSILTKKGLEDIVNKNNKERTKEEKQLLKDAKKEIEKEIADLRKENSDKSVLDAIEVLYSIDSSYKQEKEARSLKVEEDNIKNVIDNGELLPARIVSNNVREKDYTPGKAPEEFDYDKVLVKTSEFDSNTMVKEDEFKRIMGFDFDPSKYEINVDEGVNSNDGEIVEQLQIFEKVPKKVEDNTDEQINNINYDSSDVSERIVVYQDMETGEYFIRKSALNRFDLKPIEEGVRIDGALCYKISEKDYKYIEAIKDNEVSPYNIVVKKIKLQEDKKEEETEKDKDKGTKDVREGTQEDKQKEEKEQEEKVEDTEDKKEDKQTKEKVEQKVEKPRPHVEKILHDLTNGLDIHKNDGKRFKASNIKVFKGFKDELRSGNWLYNVVHVGVAVVKVPINLIRKAIGKITTFGRGKKAMTEIQNRLNNLSEEELDVLFNEYKGHQLKTDMNNQINPLIVDKLREYGLAKVEKLNTDVKEDYAMLFTLLGKIKIVEEQLAKANKEEAKNLLEQRRELLKTAANFIDFIEEDRLEADNLLSSGVHGLEEDFKAVSTKLSYVGKRFAKVGKFDNELQTKLADYGQGLRNAQAANDAEGIVNNFMGLESCYYKNTKVKGSLFGKRSVGAKYFSPVAEEFDYRNDPFFTDLLTTIVLTTSAVSALNSLKVKAANEDALRQHQAEINSVNRANNQTMADVHQVGNNITGKGDSYMEGIKSSVHQDSLNVAGTAERGAMDATDWGFGDYYRSLDSANHEMYNSLYDNAVSRLDDIAKQYTEGALTQTEALRQMADVQSYTQNGLASVINDYKDICQTYADTHTQFDLHSILDSMDYISNNPDAITTMVESGISNIEEAAKLAGMSVEQATALSSLDSDLLTTLIGAGSAAALAGRVVRTMSDNAKGGKYKNTNKEEIKAMFDEYYADSEEKSEEKSR